ncbi:poly A polymerase [Bdellovibrio bacteriovorus W]|nr:poly A polymerase [Bdellovibrio bacteriovorus W]
MNIEKILSTHPQWEAVQKIYHRLNAEGYKAFLAGGCVRDALLGVPARDLDIATDAEPAVVESLFSKTVGVGKIFGVIRVLDYGSDIEVATFRTDGKYLDGRRPEGVHFSSPKEDAQRRDFTVNALFYDFASQQVIDYVDGQKDLQLKILKTVGRPEDRFKEDHLRILRAVRFVAQLDFSLEAETSKAVRGMASAVTTVSSERISEELVKLLSSQHVKKGLEALQEHELMRVLFPFRQGDVSWQAPKGALNSYELLTLFFEPCPRSELSERLKSLKLSVKAMRFIENSLKVLKDPTEFFAMTQGRQLEKLSVEGVSFALRCLRDRQRESFYKQAEFLLKTFKQWNSELPARWVNGEDLRSAVQGPLLGEALQDVYERQLEGRFQNPQDALKWVREKYVKGVSS